MTFVPSFENVAPCQYAKSGSATASVRTGCSGSLMSIRRPFPSQAPAARSSAGKTVMSWHESVDGVGPQAIPDGCKGVVGAF
jgi:hypothetical protein